MKSRVSFIVVFLLTLLLALKGVDDYAPLTEGWWHVYVRWVENGKIPYRDFEYLLPPGYIYILRIFTLVVGEHFLQLRILGAVQLGILGVCIFSILRRISPQLISGLITLASIEYLTSGTAFWSYDYVYLALTLMFVALALVLQLENANRKISESWRTWLIAGFFVGLTMSIKQSHGFWTVVAMVGMLVTNNFDKRDKLRQKIVLVTSGVLTVWIPMLMWFWLQRVSPVDIWNQIFVTDGPKGSLSQIFLGWIKNISNLYGRPGIRSALASHVGLLQSVAPFLLISFVVRIAGSDTGKSPIRQRLAVVLVMASSVLLWSFSWEQLGLLGQTLRVFAEEFRVNATIGSWQASLVLTAFLLIRNETSVCRRYLLSVAIIATSVMWACGMSGGISEIGAFFALAFALSLALQVARNHWISVTVVCLVAMAVLSTSWRQKSELPYSWWGYSTPSPSEATSRFRQGLMTGLQSSSTITVAYEQIQSVLQRTDRCDGEIIAFPHVPVVLLDVPILPSGRLGQYWYDFSTQESILNEIQRLEAGHIKAVIFLELPDSALAGHENLFYSGNSIAHRQMLDYLSQLTETMSREVIVTLNTETKLSLWVDSCVRTTL